MGALKYSKLKEFMGVIDKNFDNPIRISTNQLNQEIRVFFDVASSSSLANIKKVLSECGFIAPDMAPEIWQIVSNIRSMEAAQIDSMIEKAE